MECEDKGTDLIRAFLGVVWQDWERQRRKCCFTQMQFAKHLLLLHEKACPEFISNQENVDRYGYIKYSTINNNLI